MASLSKNFDYNLRRDHRKISYERRDWKESYLGYVPKNYEKENSGSKGLKKIKIYKFGSTLFLLQCPYGIVK